VTKDLSVNQWVYKRLRLEADIGLIFCASEARQKTVIRLILDIGLGSHIDESEVDIDDGMKMSFRKPVFGPQQIGTLLLAILALNDIEGEWGTGRHNLPIW
jgi:hypothetical protein